MPTHTYLQSSKDKVVVITGGSTGIGLEAARLFAAEGARVTILARGADKLAAAIENLAATPEAGIARDRLHSAVVDVTDEAAVQAALADIERRDGRIDILVNNAGVGFATDLASAGTDDYRRIIDTNLTGVFHAIRAVLPGMKARKSGHIINVSSIVGKIANPVAPIYCASKHALNGYTSGLQQQVAADNIRVSLVSPASVDTDYWAGRTVDRSKFLKPAEVAAAIHFIAAQPEGVLIKDLDLAAIR
ncbi:short-chain alcohol dehydrogenase [Opitutaceae bacterium TAV1]|nr:short-chain alcohol dehydrogenase [Opitutaceae bacterium TAV1]